jgi:hypothetical protein
METDYVTAIRRIGRSGVFVVEQASGSDASIRMIDAPSCAWTGPVHPAPSGSKMTSRSVTISAHCEKETMDAPVADCIAALVLMPDSSCATLQRADRPSLKLTRRTLGVAFAGRARIRDMGTSKAVILSPQP